MNLENIKIRKATVADAPLIARAMADAIGQPYATLYCGIDYIDTLTVVATAPNTQYSYRHALIAECEGRPVGAVVGYDGAMLDALRTVTLQIIKEQIGFEHFFIGDETAPGEYYIDSLGVLPEYRGRGIGRTLLLAAMQQAFDTGHQQVGLLVAPENPRAKALYESIGFRHVDERPFFGIEMHHMQCAKV